jgi:hypothetical protein
MNKAPYCYGSCGGLGQHARHVHVVFLDQQHNSARLVHGADDEPGRCGNVLSGGEGYKGMERDVEMNSSLYLPLLVDEALPIARGAFNHVGSPDMRGKLRAEPLPGACAAIAVQNDRHTRCLSLRSIERTQGLVK